MNANILRITVCAKHQKSERSVDKGRVWVTTKKFINIFDLYTFLWGPRNAGEKKTSLIRLSKLQHFFLNSNTLILFRGTDQLKSQPPTIVLFVLTHKWMASPTHVCHRNILSHRDRCAAEDLVLPIVQSVSFQDGADGLLKWYASAEGRIAEYFVPAFVALRISELHHKECNGVYTDCGRYVLLKYQISVLKSHSNRLLKSATQKKSKEFMKSQWGSLKINTLKNLFSQSVKYVFKSCRKIFK